MHADYFKAAPDNEYWKALQLIKVLVPNITTLWRMETYQAARMTALQLARNHTKRTKILRLAEISSEANMSQAEDSDVIPAGNAAQICVAIATSAERLAALVVEYDQAAPFYYKKVRELASAEGAVMIWDALASKLGQTDTRSNLSKNSQPDLICFSTETAVWLGGKGEIMTKASYQLPNGQWIHQLNAYETDFVFKEIFVDECYLNYGIHLPPNAVVFDVGANIGLFSLYVKQKFPTSKLYAFEPIPAIYQLLCLNTAAFGNSMQTYNCALADRAQTMPFSYYPGYSVISGLQVNKQRAAEILTSGMRTYNAKKDLQTAALVNQRLEPQTSFQCQVTTLSTVIQQAGITKIDLLKIDVEGAELAVLNGITESDWPKIRQIVIEVHSPQDLTAIMALLADKPFNLHVEADKRLQSSGIYNLFAIGVEP